MNTFRFIVRFWLFMLLVVQGTVGEAQHYVSIGGVVDSTFVLSKLGADSAYLVESSLTVTDSGVLRINSGVKMYFSQSAYLRVDGGSLHVEGQENDSVYLLCYEFSHDWTGVQLINVSSEDTVRMSYVNLVGALTALSASSCNSVDVRHCTFNNYYAGSGIELNDCNGFVVDSCFFNRCNSGLALKARTGDCENNCISHCIFDQGQINIEVSNAGYGYKCNNNVITDNCFQGAATAISFESVGGMIDKDAKNFILNNLISSDLPEGSGNYSSYGIKAAMDSLVICNNVFWGNDEAVTMLRVCHLVFENNTFYDNGFVISRLQASGSMGFVGNTVSLVQNRVVSFPSGKSRMNGNNFLHHKKGAVPFANISAEDVDMEYNYWGTDSSEEIEKLLLDHHSNLSLGEIQYEPYLHECDTSAPISPPFEVKKQWVDDTWLVSWEGNPESDLDHYVLFYGDFNYYRFTHRIDSIFGHSCVLASQQAENVAVVACDRVYNPDVYASKGQSAYAFATSYPYAGSDGTLCASEGGFEILSATIPYTYNRFVWRSSGTGAFSDSLSLHPIYYPSEEDFDAGEVVLTLLVLSGGEEKTDMLHLQLFKRLEVFAGDDYYSGLDRPIVLDRATASGYDSVCWRSLGDGQFEDPNSLQGIYFPGGNDKQKRFVQLLLEAWSFCGYACDTVRFDLFEEFSMEGKTWFKGLPIPDVQLVAAGMNDDNPFFSGFYRTVSDAEGTFRFKSLLPDRYVLYAFPDTLDMIQGGVYYLGDYQWNESNIITVDGDVYDVDIVMPDLIHGIVGGGRISGVFDYPEIPFKAHGFYCGPWLRSGDSVEYCSSGLSNVGVLLMNETKQRLMGFALTDANGAFHFDGLPYGTYHVLADLPRYGRGLCERISLSPMQPKVNDLHLYITLENKVAMHPWNTSEIEKTWSVYPNPVESQITIKGMETVENYVVMVTNALGNVVIPSFRVKTDWLGECSFSVDYLSKGVYFIVVEGLSGRQIIKFVKY